MFDRCPYCGTSQPEALRQGEWWRCHGCNFHVCGEWLVDDPDEYVLNETHEVLCPWCGFPVGLKQQVPEEKEFMCQGCAGTLFDEMLVSQALLLRDRESGAKFRKQLLLLLFFLAFMAFIMGNIVR